MKIFHTNDIHSEYIQLEKLSTFFKINRKESDLYLDAGDISDLKSLMVIGSTGLVSAHLLNQLNIDAMAVGNNESELGLEWVQGIAQEMPLLSCNLRTLANEVVGDIKTSKIIVRDGIRFLVIGTSPYYRADLTMGGFNYFLSMDGMKVIEPIAEIQREILNYKDQMDVCILLSHSGIETDQMMAEKIEGIDIIVGGHSHSQLDQPLEISGTLIVQAKCLAEYVGCLDLRFEDKKIKQWTYELIKLNHECDTDFHALIEACQTEAIHKLNEPLTCIEELEFDLFKECRLINFICDALKLLEPCDLSIMYHGIVNYGLKGNVSKMDLIQCSPSKLNPTRFVVKGKQIMDAYRQSLDHAYCSQEGFGPGFRGGQLGTLSFSHNVEIQGYDLYIDGTKCIEDKTYVVMSDDYIQRGTKYESLKTNDEDAKFFPGFIRDLIEQNLSNQSCFLLSTKKRRSESHV